MYLDHVKDVTLQEIPSVLEYHNSYISHGLKTVQIVVKEKNKDGSEKIRNTNPGKLILANTEAFINGTEEKINKIMWAADKAFEDHFGHTPMTEKKMEAWKKDEDFNKAELEKKLADVDGIASFKFILIFNEGADLNDSFTLLWLLGGNLEPTRDVSIISANNAEVVLVDATFKTDEHDNFKRDWPNVVTMDDKTITKINTKWDELGLGDFIESPSLKFKLLVRGNGAVRED